MKKTILLSLFVFSLFGCNLSAQKVRYGYVNLDSLLQLIPGYSEADQALQEKRSEFALQRQRMLEEIDERIANYDSLKGKLSPLIDTLRQLQIKEMKENLTRLDQYIAEDLQYDSIRVAAFRFQLDEAITVVSKKKKRVIISHLDKNSLNALNLNDEVAAQLKRKENLQAEPKQIGYVNRDSLLRLIPEYKEIKERNEQASAKYYSWYWDYSFENVTITDSASIVALDSIHRADSIACAPYELKFKQAWEAEMKERKVFYISESQYLHEVWPGEKVQFINMDKEFAERLE